MLRIVWTWEYAEAFTCNDELTRFEISDTFLNTVDDRLASEDSEDTDTTQLIAWQFRKEWLVATFPSFENNLQGSFENVVAGTEKSGWQVQEKQFVSQLDMRSNKKGRSGLENDKTKITEGITPAILEVRYLWIPIGQLEI